MFITWLPSVWWVEEELFGPVGMVLEEGFGDFGIDLFAELRSEEIGVVAAGDNFDVGVAAKFREGFLEVSNGTGEVEGILVSHENMELTSKLRGEGGPIRFEDVANVVFPPFLGDYGVDAASFPIPERKWFTIFAAWTEDGFETVELAAGAEDLLHGVEVAIPDDWFASSVGKGAEISLGVDPHRGVRFVDVDVLKVLEIDRVGSGAPDAAKQVRVGDL